MKRRQRSGGERMNQLTLLGMFACHIFCDFHLQGILADMKQKVWWQKNYPDKEYENDYKVALAIHSLEWAIWIMFPVIVEGLIIGKIYETGFDFRVVALVVANTCLHYCVDDTKANKLIINLKEDQLIHAAQIFATWALMGR